MNLGMFLKEVDGYINPKEKDDLVHFIHTIARLLPENKRDEFLKLLKERDQSKVNSVFIKERKKSLDKEYQELNVQLSKTENKEIGIKVIYNENYDDWYNDINDEFYYNDPDCIGNIIRDAVLFIEQCIDAEYYQEGYDIAKRLIDLKIEANNENVIEEFTVFDFNYHGLISFGVDR